eukprot:3580903-Pleurochrysis_carterae.AAC.1
MRTKLSGGAARLRACAVMPTIGMRSNMSTRVRFLSISLQPQSNANWKQENRIGLSSIAKLGSNSAARARDNGSGSAKVFCARSDDERATDAARSASPCAHDISSLARGRQSACARAKICASDIANAAMQRIQAPDLLRRLKAVELGHVDVHQDEVKVTAARRRANRDRRGKSAEACD